MAATFILYHYTPSLPAAVIFTLLFSVVTFLHAIQLIRLRAWFTIPVIVGGLCTHLPSFGSLLNCTPNF